jgi:rubrerythrin
LNTPCDILQAALEKETQARDFYADLAARSNVDYVKELLLTLQNEEFRHMRMIEKMLARLNA